MNSLMSAIPPLLKGNTLGVTMPQSPDNIPLRQEDYPHVRFWTARPYHVFNAAKKEANENEGISLSKLRGGSRLALDINVKMMYLEDENGVSVTGSRAQLTRNVAYGIWNELLALGLLPEKWGSARNDVLLQFYSELGAQVPEM